MKSMVTKMPKNIGEKIKDLRNEKDWSLRELENRTGINYSVLSRIESGKRPLTDQEVIIFADLFDVSSDFLLGRIDQPYSEPLQTITTPKKKPSYSKIGSLISAQMAGRRISNKSVMELLSINQEELIQILSGEIAPSERQAQIFASLFDTRPEMYLPKKELINQKDEKDIAKRMEQIKKDLTGIDGLTFNGEPMSEEAVESFLEAMEYAVRQTQRINKKYIPKKYRENEDID
jgi:transcriptional regulator with XRE-family HTH domain